MKFAVLSDIHYISPRLAVEGCNEDLIDTAVAEKSLYQAAEDADVLIIHGDVTNSGDIYSHEDLVKILYDIKAKGKRIFVTFATHDYHHHRAYMRMTGDNKIKFSSRPWEMPYFNPDTTDWHSYLSDEDKIRYKDVPDADNAPKLVPTATPEEIWKMYYDFGPSEAISVNEESFSYCCQLDDGLRVLILNDIFRNEEALSDKSPSFTPACFKWIEQCKAQADADGSYIFAVSHHPFIPASPAHFIGADYRNLRSPYTGHILADMGIDLVFTGHTHFNNIGFLTSDKGNILCDITTPGTHFLPPEYRLVWLDGKTENIKYETVEIGIPDGIEIPDETLGKYYRRQMYEEYYNKICGKDNFVGKLLRKLTVGDIHFLFSGAADLTKDEYAQIKDMLIFDLLTSLAFNMLTGDGQYTPDTAVYKFSVAMAAGLDSICDHVPFIDIKGKFLKGYTVFEVIDALCFDNKQSCRNAEFCIRDGEKKKCETHEPKSCLGAILMTILCILFVILLPITPVAALVALIIGLVKKSKAVKNGGKKPPRY